MVDERTKHIQERKIELALRRADIYRVYQKVRNEYGEPIRDGEGRYILEPFGCIRGVYHTSNSYVSQTVAEMAVWHTRQTPMILTSFCDGYRLKPVDHMIEVVKDVYYEVVKATDISDMGIAYDVSMEYKDGEAYVLRDGHEPA